MSQCKAHRTNGDPCRARALAGGTVCRVHGGSAPQVKEAARRRLLELVSPALARLDRIVRDDDDQRSLQAAAKILDLAGVGEPERVEVITKDMIDTEIARLTAKLAEQKRQAGVPDH